jgi:hypothetical protein
MANPEARHCTPEEYNRGKRARLFVGELAYGGLYKLMARIGIGEKPYRGFRAYEARARINDLESVGHGIHVIEFDVLDSQQTPGITTALPFRDGYLLYDGAPNAFEKGYFRNDHPNLGAPALEAATAGWVQPDLPADTPLEELVEAYLP